MVSAQQMNLLPKNASQNDAIFAQKVYRIYATTSQYLSSYGCVITMVYMYIIQCKYTYIYIRYDIMTEMFVNKILQMSLPDCTRLKWPQPLSTN